jgi:teichuronic acid biosynthesis glycosyltransferase TuaC
MENVMRVLFVSSGNLKDFCISPFVKAQAESLEKIGIKVEFFPIIGGGFWGYIKNLKKLRIYLRRQKFDVIHAHYVLCGWIAVFAMPRVPIVLSLMGADAYGNYYKPNKVSILSRYLTLLTLLIQPFVKGIISKSFKIDSYVYRKKIAKIIPNGVDLEKFHVVENNFCDQLGLNKLKKNILFLGRKEDPNKNFVLLQDACNLLDDKNIEIIAPFLVSQDKVVKYLWSVDVFVLPSFMEGSANVVKEAMACNCPMVVTNAGDSFWVTSDTEGCFHSTHDSLDFKEKILMALDYAERKKRTNGRQKLMEKGLDSETTAYKIAEVYKNAMK